MDRSVSATALCALLPPLESFGPPRYAALATAIRALVLDGRIAAGTRLPAERALAQHLPASRALVAGAYEQLREAGFLQSRPGSGSVVIVPSSVIPMRSGTAGTEQARSFGPGTSGVRTAGWTDGRTAGRTGPTEPSRPDGVIDLSVAAPLADPHLLAELFESAAARIPALSLHRGYDPTGLTLLRERVAARFSERGAPTDPSQIMITNGALHAFDLVLRATVGPGDRVLAEVPTYSGALDAIRASGARLISAPIDPHTGWADGEVASAIEQAAPRLAYLVPDFQNPTGVLVPTEDRRRALRAARRHGSVVVADESCVELGLVDAEPPMSALDPRVITVGSITKVVWGGIRVGWVRGPLDLIDRLATVRAGSDIAGSVFDQLVAVEMFDRLPQLRAERVEQLRLRRDTLLAALADRLPSWRVRVPDGGLSVWVELPRPLATALTMAAAGAGVVLISGSRFGAHGTLERFVRIPYALPPSELLEAVGRLATAWEQVRELAGSDHVANLGRVVG